MLSPVGCNAFQCFSHCELSLSDLHHINKQLAWCVMQYLVIPQMAVSLNIIIELLYVIYN